MPVLRGEPGLCGGRKGREPLWAGSKAFVVGPGPRNPEGRGRGWEGEDRRGAWGGLGRRGREQREDAWAEPRGAYFGEVTEDKRDERHL